MRIRNFIASLMLAGATAGMGLSASATTLQKLEFEDMVSTADAIVHGRVVASKSMMVNGERVTRSTIEVMDDMLGNVGSTISVDVPGGAIAGGKFRMGEVIAGAPQFLNGAEVVLLLDAGVADAYQVSGFNQGALTVFQADGVASVTLPDGKAGAVSLQDAKSRMTKIRGAK